MTTLYTVIAIYALLIVGRLFAPAGVRVWVVQIVQSIDRLVNAIHGGSAAELISSRCGRIERYPYKLYRPLIDAIFYPFQGPNHCRRTYLKERAGFYLPPEYRR
jgi:hypothetical protein